MISNLELFLKISKTALNASHKNLNHGVTNSLSVRSAESVLETALNKILSGVCAVSKSSSPPAPAPPASPPAPPAPALLVAAAAAAAFSSSSILISALV